MAAPTPSPSQSHLQKKKTQCCTCVGHTYTYVHTCVRTYILTYMHTYIDTCICTCVRTYMHVYVYIYICIHIHEQTCMALPEFHSVRRLVGSQQSTPKRVIIDATMAQQAAAPPKRGTRKLVASPNDGPVPPNFWDANTVVGVAAPSATSLKSCCITSDLA